MKNMIVLLTAAVLLVGCVHDRNRARGAGSTDGGMTRGQGAGTAEMHNNPLMLYTNDVSGQRNLTP